MKRIESGKNTMNKTSIVQEYVGMELVDGEFAPITIPRLIPLKFNTVWQKDYSVMETVLSYGTMLPREIEVPKTELRITTSPFILSKERDLIINGLIEYNKSKGYSDIDFRLKPKSEFEELVCTIMGKNLCIELSEVQPINNAQLAGIERAASAHGARNTVIFIPHESPEDAKLKELEDEWKDKGFETTTKKAFDEEKTFSFVMPPRNRTS